MYLDYFSLKKFPFRITPDPTLFFSGGADGRGVVLDALIYAITSGEGILKVVGEVGSGKTMLCRMLGGKLSDSVEIVYLANPNLSARDIIFAIAFELELDVDSSTDRLLAMHKLQEYLLKKHSGGGTVVVFIEEAQSMPLEALEEIRLLSNLETHQHKLMQIVLFGQPELDTKLQKKSIRQLRERITHSFNLEPLTVDSTRDYIRFRLRAAGCPWPQLFSPQAEKLLAKAASGLTRRINILADKSLMAAYADSSTRQEPRNSAGEIQAMVLPRHVKAAIKDCGYRNSFSSLFRFAGLSLLSISTVGLMVFFVAKLDFWSELQLFNSDNDQGTVISVPVLESQILSTVSIEANNSIESLEESPSDSLPEIPQPEPEENQELIVEEVPSSNLADLALPEVSPLEESPLEESALERASEIMEVVLEDEEIEPQVEPLELVEEVIADEPAAVSELIDQPIVLIQEAPIAAVEQFEASDNTLVAIRSRAAKSWLENLSGESAYTLQLISISAGNRSSLEEFLQFFSVTGLLENTYVCAISATNRNPEQWLVLHEEFSGVTTARNYMDSMPAHLKRFSPYIRNTSDVACKE